MATIDERLMEVLACPQCREPLEHKDRRKALLCTGCSLQYPIVDGIPHLLVEEARPGRR